MFKVVMIAGALAAAILASCSSGVPDYDVTATAEIRHAELTVESEQRNATATREREIVKATADVVTATASAKGAEATANAAPLATSRAATRVATTATAAPQATARAEARATERAAAPTPKPTAARATEREATPTPKPTARQDSVPFRPSDAQLDSWTDRITTVGFWMEDNRRASVECAQRGSINASVFGSRVEIWNERINLLIDDLEDGTLDYGGHTLNGINDLVAEGEDIVAGIKRLCGLR